MKSEIRIARELVRIAKLLVGNVDQHKLLAGIDAENPAMHSHAIHFFMMMSINGVRDGIQVKMSELLKKYDASKYDSDFFTRLADYLSEEGSDIKWITDIADLYAVQELWTCDKNNGPANFDAYKSAFNHIQSKISDRGMCRFFMKFSESSLYFICRMGANMTNADVKYALDNLDYAKIQDLLKYDTIPMAFLSACVRNYYDDAGLMANVMSSGNKSRLTPHLLTVLSGSSVDAIRSSVACNPNTDARTLKKLSKDSNPRVKSNAEWRLQRMQA